MATPVQICNLALSRIGYRAADYLATLQDTTTQAQSCAVLFPVDLDTVTESCPWKFAEKHSILGLVNAPYAAWSSLTTYAQGALVTVGGTPGFFTSLAGGNLNNAPATGGTTWWSYTPIYSRTGWNYMYAVPSDLVRLLNVIFQIDEGLFTYVPSPPTPQPSYLRNPIPQAKEQFSLEASDDGATQFLLTNTTVAEVIYIGSLQQRNTFPALFSDALAWLLARDLAMALAVKKDFAVNAQQMYEATLQRAFAAQMNGGELLHERESEFILGR